MGATIYYDKRTVLGASATTAADGYPAANVATQSLRRPWRSVGTGANDVTLPLAALVAVHSFCIHAANFATCTVRKSADGVAFTTVGVLTAYPDRHGRYRGRIVVNDPGVKAIQIQIGAGTPADAAPYWSLGAAYPMGSAHVVPADLIFPVNEEVVEPAFSTELANKQVAEASAGERFSKIDTVWQRESIESLQTLIQKTRGYTVWFDAGTSDYPEQQWPLYLPLQSSVRESFDRFRFSKPTLSFVERV